MFFPQASHRRGNIPAIPLDADSIDKQWCVLGQMADVSLQRLNKHREHRQQLVRLAFGIAQNDQAVVKIQVFHDKLGHFAGAQAQIGAKRYRQNFLVSWALKANLIKFEKTVSDRVKLVDLLRLDQAFELNGKLLAFAWRTGELYTGTLRIQSQPERGSKIPKEWTEMELKKIERLIFASRLYECYLGISYLS